MWSALCIKCILAKPTTISDFSDEEIVSQPSTGRKIVDLDHAKEDTEMMSIIKNNNLTVENLKQMQISLREQIVTQTTTPNNPRDEWSPVHLSQSHKE